MRHGKKKALILAAAATIGMAKDASGANATWNLSPVSGNSWSTTNWSSGASTTYTPVADDALFFGTSNTTTTNNNFAANTNFLGITFNAGASAFTLTGNAVNLINDITDNATNNQNVNLAVTFSTGAHTITNSGSGVLAFGAALTRGQGTTINFVPTGNITLTGATTAGTGNVLVINSTAFATAGGNDWATYGTSVGTLSSYQTNTDPTTWVSTDVSLSSDPSSFVPTTTINTLKFAGG